MRLGWEKAVKIKEYIEGDIKEKLIVGTITHAEKEAADILETYVPGWFREELTPPLLEMFRKYMAIYLIQKEGLEISYLSRHPLVEIGSRMKTFGIIYRIPQYFDMVNKEAVSRLKLILTSFKVDQNPGRINKIQILANMITTMYLEYKTKKKKERDPEELKMKIENYLNSF